MKRLPKPVWNQDGIVLYRGDARELLPLLIKRGDYYDAIVTDPPWPGADPAISGSKEAAKLFGQVAKLAPQLADRLVVHLGRDTDPRMLAAVPASLPFFAVCWLRLMPASRKKRMLNGGEVAYVFGAAPYTGQHQLLPSDPPVEVLACSAPGRRRIVNGHPCPRRREHVAWLLKWYGGARVLDPFAGSGTTLEQAKDLGLEAVGIEIDKTYCEIIVDRLRQRVMFPPKEEACPTTTQGELWTTAASSSSCPSPSAARASGSARSEASSSRTCGDTTHPARRSSRSSAGIPRARRSRKAGPVTPTPGAGGLAATPRRSS